MDTAVSILVAKRFEAYWKWGLLIIGVVLTYHLLSLSLIRTNILSGMVLFGFLVILGLFSLRKKVPFLPLGTAAGWLNFHIFSGLFTLVLFALHIGIEVPHGYLDVCLALVYLGVVLSGIIGLGLSTWVPKQLGNCGEEVIFERIPILQKQLREEAEGLMELTGKGELGKFYMSHVFPFFEKTQYSHTHLFNTDRTRQELLNNLRAKHSFFGDVERESAQKLETLIHTKFNLDRHATFQGFLKSWLFIHIPLTASLLILSMTHGIIAYLYSPRFF